MVYDAQQIDRLARRTLHCFRSGCLDFSRNVEAIKALTEQRLSTGQTSSISEREQRPDWRVGQFRVQALGGPLVSAKGQLLCTTSDFTGS